MNVELKNRLRYLRQNAGFSQREFSQVIGIPAGSLSKYEIGENTPPVDVLVKLANYFGVTTDYLVGLSNDINSEGAATGFDYIYILGADGTRKMIQIPEEKRERVKAMLSAGFPELIEE